MKSKNTTFLTKVFTFCAAHQYGNKKWTDKENWDVFGKDTRVHGHNYTLHVTVTGDINPDSGFLVDLGHLKKIVNVFCILKTMTICPCLRRDFYPSKIIIWAITN